MKILLDENIGKSVVRYLENNGYDVIDIGQNLSGAKDEIILKKSFHEKRILITLDQDFGELVFHQLLPHCGVILLRPLKDSIQTRIKLIEYVLRNLKKYLRGRFVVINEKMIRIK